jgi:LmbE family N-acetylglucosaminyl deacetylase
MEPDKLLVVAHPDDELLWGGANLVLEPGWHVVCSTNLNNPVRSAEFYKTMSWCNVLKYDMYSVEDKYTEEEAEADRLYDGTPFDSALQELAKKSWKLVLTHNDKGEYGHEHHRKVNRMVLKYFPSAKVFQVGPPLNPAVFEVKRYGMLFYANTQAITRKIFNKEEQTLKPDEREHAMNEVIYVQQKREIPKIIHQIWFGKPVEKMDANRKKLVDSVKKVAERNGFVYKLWTNADLSQKNFPLVWEEMQRSIEAGKKVNQSRFAQVADLARYEIIHRFGGVYLDSLFEIGDAFCAEIVANNKSKLIVANEDPCGLECVSKNGKYLSNGFFASVPGSICLKRLLHPDTLKYINYDSVYVNRETGPYYFRRGIQSQDVVHVIETEKIYPFMVNDSQYRPKAPNQCIGEGRKLIDNCLETKYPNSLAVYQSGFGGSWSF